MYVCVCSMLSRLASQRLTSNRSVSLRPIGSHETCRLRTRPIPLHRPSCYGSPFVRYRTADLRSPSFRGRSRGHMQDTVVFLRIRSYRCPTSRPSSVYPHRAGSTPQWDGPITHLQKTAIGGTINGLGQSRTDKRPPSGEQQMQMQNLSPPF
jgi:hypothetical protein